MAVLWCHGRAGEGWRHWHQDKRRAENGLVATSSSPVMAGTPVARVLARHIITVTKLPVRPNLSPPSAYPYANGPWPGHDTKGQPGHQGNRVNRLLSLQGVQRRVGAHGSPPRRSKDRKIHHKDTKITKTRTNINASSIFFSFWCSLCLCGEFLGSVMRQACHSKEAISPLRHDGALLRRRPVVHPIALTGP